MHDADNEVTPEQLRRASAECSGYEPSLSLLQYSADMAANQLDALIAERDQLRAKLDEATKVLADVSAAMLMGGDGAVGDYGWSIGKLNQARPAIRTFLASAPEPEADAGPVAETDAPTKVLHYNRENPPDEIVDGALAGGGE